eukprot:scaffold136201_cov54-Attheya_sp.AAC.2
MSFNEAKGTHLASQKEHSIGHGEASIQYQNSAEPKDVIDESATLSESCPSTGRLAQHNIARAAKDNSLSVAKYSGNLEASGALNIHKERVGALDETVELHSKRKKETIRSANVKIVNVANFDSLRLHLHRPLTYPDSTYLVDSDLRLRCWVQQIDRHSENMRGWIKVTLVRVQSGGTGGYAVDVGRNKGNAAKSTWDMSLIAESADISRRTQYILYRKPDSAQEPESMSWKIGSRRWALHPTRSSRNHHTVTATALGMLWYRINKRTIVPSRSFSSVSTVNH